MFEYKHGSDILYFTGLCANAMPRVRERQEGGLWARLCAGAVPGELGSPVLGLVEETFLGARLLRASCVDDVCEEKGVCSILCSCY